MSKKVQPNDIIIPKGMKKSFEKELGNKHLSFEDLLKVALSWQANNPILLNNDEIDELYENWKTQELSKDIPYANKQHNACAYGAIEWQRLMYLKENIRKLTKPLTKGHVKNIIDTMEK